MLSQIKYIDALVTDPGLAETTACHVPHDVLGDLSTSGHDEANEFFPYRQLIESCFTYLLTCNHVQLW